MVSWYKQAERQDQGNDTWLHSKQGRCASMGEASSQKMASYAQKRMFQVLAQCLSKGSLLTQRGCKVSVILNIKRPKGLSSLFLPLFWLLMDYETSERTTGLLLVIRSWPKVWCADAFVTFLLVLLGLIWLTHEALCIAHSLTKTEKRPAEQINWNTVVCISLQHHLSALELRGSKLINRLQCQGCHSPGWNATQWWTSLVSGFPLQK